jgi:hypothetical protein
MVYMEVSILPKNILRLKSKQATFLINPADKIQGANAAIYLLPTEVVSEDEATVILDGPGEYEIGGVKLSGMRVGESVVYSLSLDGVEVMVGDIPPLEKLQHKVKEHDMVILCTDTTSPTSAAFSTGLATSYLLCFGANGKALIDSFGKENATTTNKLSVTKDKLPPELQTVLLADVK